VTARYRQDAAYELSGAEAELRSVERSLKNTANGTTAAIAQSKLPGLQRKVEALKKELDALPDRPSHLSHGVIDTSKWAHIPYPPHPTGDPFEIPEFLLRKENAK
jgi:hypothetical protein